MTILFTLIGFTLGFNVCLLLMGHMLDRQPDQDTKDIVKLIKTIDLYFNGVDGLSGQEEQLAIKEITKK